MTTTNWKAPALSPRELGHALGVSESSIKRWIDSGRLAATRTAGGHRRIEFLSALRFARDSNQELVRPGALGLPGTDELGSYDSAELGDGIAELLLNGDEPELTRLLLATLATRILTPAELFDGPVRSALVEIGNLWNGGTDGIFAEHRATQILLRALDQVEALFESEHDSAPPIAVGGSLAGDSSSLPTRMAAIVLAGEGFRTVNLGADTPVDVFLEAADRLDARIVWVSVGHVNHATKQRNEIIRLSEALERRGARCLLGGRQIEHLGLPEALGLRIGSSMHDLVNGCR